MDGLYVNSRVWWGPEIANYITDANPIQLAFRLEGRVAANGRKETQIESMEMTMMMILLMQRESYATSFKNKWSDLQFSGTIYFD